MSVIVNTKKFVLGIRSEPARELIIGFVSCYDTGMQKKISARIRGFAFILWHMRHMGYHILIGLLWAWILREWWGVFNPRWFITAVLGSVLPDIDHFLYYLGYGRYDGYTREIKQFLRTHQWRMVTVFIERGHKYNTELSYHNIYVVVILFLVTSVCIFFDWKTWVVLLGAMIGHYLFDIIDDIIVLGYINSNWKRWGNGRRKAGSRYS